MTVVPFISCELVFISLIPDLTSGYHLLHLVQSNAPEMSELLWLTGEEGIGPTMQSPTEVARSFWLESDVICT